MAKLAPEWANYGAIDSDGSFMWFENRPVTLIRDGIVGGWISGGKEEREDRVAFFSSARWFLTLVERPVVPPQKKMTVNDFVKEAHQNAVDKGFWVGKRELGTLLMLVTSELSEALEADRRSNWCVTPVDPDNFDTDEEFKAAFERTQKDTVQDEIADAFIRLADLCGHYHIDTERFIRAKMKYNSLRPVKHGKSY